MSDLNRTYPAVYRHNKSGAFYIATHESISATNGEEDAEPSVSYFSVVKSEFFHRRVSEFYSPGRFTECEYSLFGTDSIISTLFQHFQQISEHCKSAEKQEVSGLNLVVKVSPGPQR